MQPRAIVSALAMTGFAGLSVGQSWMSVHGNTPGVGGPVVKVQPNLSFGGGQAVFPFSYTGGTTVAVGDTTNDRVNDIIVGAASGTSHVQVVSGADSTVVQSFFAFDPAFTGGVTVASGDVNRDGFADIVVGAASLSSQIKVFSGRDGSVLQSFFAFSPSFTGGVNVAVADTDGDGYGDIVAGTRTGSSQISTFSGRDNSLLNSFFAFAPAFTGGVSVAAADFGSNGRASIIAGTQSRGEQVKIFNNDLSERASFLAYAPSFTGGLNVGVTNVSTFGNSVLVTTNNGFPGLQLFDPLNGSLQSSTFGFWQAGSYVAGNWKAAPVPEPSALLFGLAGIGLWRRRKRALSS